MKTKFTPGPWSVLLNPMGSDSIIGDDCRICDMPSWDVDYADEESANTHLIAAAPELLTWLKWSTKYLSNEAKQSGQYTMLLAAIAKAEGGAA